jgi:Protein of unknown function (DUF1592)/Protein of unknown function (DUF1588)/Protein of unknown function (DUF1595)/Protein of unknown function (DUF1585)/Protein of unknown function (DUF1587)
MEKRFGAVGCFFGRYTLRPIVPCTCDVARSFRSYAGQRVFRPVNEMTLRSPVTFFAFGVAYPWLRVAQRDALPRLAGRGTDLGQMRASSWRWLGLGALLVPTVACSGRSLWFGQLRGEGGRAESPDSSSETDDTWRTAPSGSVDARYLDAGPGASDSKATTDVSSADAGPKLVAPASECVSIPSTSQQRFLTNRQYDRTVADLLGLTALADGRPPSSLLAPDHTGEIDAVTWAGYLRAAEEIARRVVDTPELLASYVSCDLESTGCLNATMATFGRRAFRRPLTVEDTTSLSIVIDRGKEITDNGTPLEVAEALLYTFLVSPSFLLRSEIGETTDEQGQYLLSDHEVAQRLSYALWGTMPDAELFGAADRGELGTQEEIHAQATRMLQDVKARDQAKLFHAIYVGAEGSSFWNAPTKDTDLFPDFPTSSPVFRQETELFFEHVMFDSKGELEDLFLSSVAFVNQDTAPLYGLSQEDFGADLELVSLDADERPGFLTRVGFLAVNSFPSRTWPSRRGAEIFRHVVGLDVGEDALVETQWVDDAELDTVRKQVDAFTGGAGCSPCHELINPLGFVLEGFDAVGRAQTHEARTGAPIDTRADVFADWDVEPVSIANPLELMQLLVKSPQVSATYAREWVDFLRESEPDGRVECIATELAVKLTAGGYTIRDLVADIVASESFSKRVPLD